MRARDVIGPTPAGFEVVPGARALVFLLADNERLVRTAASAMGPR